MNKDHTDWNEAVLQFWFKELTAKDWFSSSEALDASITDRFAPAHKAASAEQNLPTDATPLWALSVVIVLDQFSRNMFRGSRDAFAFDHQSLTFAKQALERDFDKTLTSDEKQFLYMPFMHAENIDDQKTAVALFTELARPEHAVEHMAIIEKFGRFPHRNAVLGRKSTAAESEYLKDAKRFGQ